MIEDWLEDAREKLRKMPEKSKEVRDRALNDLYFFACLVNPGYMYGEVHKEIFQWLQEYTLAGAGQSLTSNKLIMLPRAHLKSHMVATWCAWIIARHPEITILYVSATAELAITQLYDIKNILGGTVFQRYFPEYLHPQEGKRAKWSSTSVIVDHPRRVQEGIRDATIKVAGLTTNTTGWHADVIVSDDLVVPENAYTEDGRESVAKKSSQFTSIRNPGGFTLACGTRYHPSDIYATWKEQMYDEYTEDGQLIDKLPVWEVKEFKVEESGVFLWPRRVRSDGKAFGFDMRTLSRIKAEYIDITQFYAQYYNDPNDPSSDRISRDKFQYASPKFLSKEGGRWFYNSRRLNIYAAVDFAFSLSRGADYTAIVVVGVDCDGNIYVLDIERFKTNKTIDYFKKIRDLHSKWKFNKLRAEVTVAQVVIVEAIKDFVRKDGLTLSVEEYRPSRHEGSKEERIAAALEHRYDDMKVWHFEGGWTGVLEEELIQARPAHDDIKDALASAVSIAVVPSRPKSEAIQDFMTNTFKRSRFGGVPYR
jgi:hypothetical protein